ncbi:ACT domain-containing protein [Streptomyces sp. R28]|uniref:ACT domain-containing protein n=1 Tax=Streptomyces sp. R28 TaxID=3238628 RepID=A0AB39Q2U0_9ACTN
MQFELRPLEGRFVVERAKSPADVDQDTWLALVRAPEGLTVIRRATPTDPDATERWSALYGGDTPHALDLPGVLARLLTPLAEAGVPVFVASTYDADVILVPEAQLTAAGQALGEAGVTVTSPAQESGTPPDATACGRPAPDAPPW